MAAGTNRLNRYTVARATIGLSKWLLSSGENKSVIIAYDTRNNSREFAKVTADVLSQFGIKVLLFKEPTPTPMLSYSVIMHKADAGVVITASHNPKEYNGYKVYNKYGCQLSPEECKYLLEEINKVDDYSTIKFDSDDKFISIIYEEEARSYTDTVCSLSLTSERNVKVVYTPLCGAGYKPVKMVFEKAGFDAIYVDEQCVQSGDFPTLRSPNPEEKDALTLGIKKAALCNADIVIGTDPDSDRMGTAVKHNGEYVLISGNCMGALLVNYIVLNKKVTNKDVIIKTVVTNSLGTDIAKAHGMSVFEVLTGFKNICTYSRKLEENGYKFVFGYEESYGYLYGNYVADKDGVSAALLAAEMCAYYKKNGKTLVDVLDELYAQFGYYYDDLHSFTLKGIEGTERIKSIMEHLRSKSPFDNADVIDYTLSKEEMFITNMLKYVFDDGSWIAVRPSGTEPKIKFYYSVVGKNKEDAITKTETISKKIEGWVGLI